MSYIPRDQLLVRGVYEVRGRNLISAVWTGTLFLGERIKFGESFIDSEYHCDDGTSLSTVKPLHLIGRLHESIPLSIGHPLIDALRKMEA